MLLLCINRISISIRIVIFLLPHWLTPNCMIGDVKYDFHRCGAHTLTHTHIPFHICKHHLADQPTWKFHTSKKFNNISKRARLPNMWCGLWCDVICHVSQSLVNFSFFLSLSLSCSLSKFYFYLSRARIWSMWQPWADLFCHRIQWLTCLFLSTYLFASCTVILRVFFI